MTWTLEIYRIPGLHERRCQSAACGDRAVFHATTCNGVDHKAADLCQLCAELAANKVGKKLPSKAPQTWPIPDSGIETTCASCGAGVLWARTTAGKSMPINAIDGVSHFLSCPYAAFHRSKQSRRARV